MLANKDDAEKCLELGQKFTSQGNFDSAVKWFNKSLTLYPLPGVQSLRDNALHQISTKITTDQPEKVHNDQSQLNPNEILEHDFDVWDVTSWLPEFFRALPSLTTKRGIGRIQLESIYRSVYQFQVEAPWRKISNSFPVKISVRISSRNDDWSLKSSRLKGMGPSEIRVFPPTAESPFCFSDIEPVVDNQITKYVVVCGNTDYDARGIVGFDDEEGVRDILMGFSNELRQRFFLQVYPLVASSQEEVKLVKKWSLPCAVDAITKTPHMLKVFHHPYSVGELYRNMEGNRLGSSLYRKAWRSLPEADQLRWMDAALRAICRFASDLVIKRTDGQTGFPNEEFEFCFPSWDMDGNIPGKNCYAFVKIRMKRFQTISSTDGRYYPGGKACFFCGAPKFVSETNPSGKLLVCCRCREIKYCSPQCQRRDWKRHKQECTKPKHK